LKTQPGQILQLNGLRGTAILFVLFFHLFDYGFLSGVFYFGWCGVDLFFVLSGFLITGILADTRHQQGYFKKFFIRRVLRIFPLYYSVLLVFAVIAPHFPVTAWFEKYQAYFWTYTSNYLILKKGFFPPLGHFWSLAIEEQFYLFWPFIIWLLKPKYVIAVSVLLIAAGIVIRYFSTNEYIIFGLPFAHLDGLMVGSIMAVLFRRDNEWLLKHITKFFVVQMALLIVYIAAYLLSYGISSKTTFVNLPFTFTLVAMFFGCFLVMSLKNEWFKQILSSPLLLFFGKYSYGMYVFNSILLYFSNWAGADRVPVNKRLIIYSGVFILTIIMSYISYNLIEIRFLRLKTKLKAIQ
jgi:peptidoglycan/LPS O-acetylase OafA/YrhL